VVARQLVKRFGDFLAVDGVDFEIGKGVLRLPRPERRREDLDHADDRLYVAPHIGDAPGARHGPGDRWPKIRSRIGLVAQEDTLDLELTVLDNLMIYGRYFDLPKKVIRERAERLLDSPN